MLLVGKVRDEKRKVVADESDSLKKINQERSIIPAVTHLDYSARLQTVNPDQHPDFYNLINAFYQLTGCPMVINTSFNRMDEPIVCTPEDAILCFLNTEIDVLVLGDFVVRKVSGNIKLCHCEERSNRELHNAAFYPNNLHHVIARNEAIANYA